MEAPAAASRPPGAALGPRGQSGDSARGSGASPPWGPGTKRVLPHLGSALRDLQAPRTRRANLLAPNLWGSDPRGRGDSCVLPSYLLAPRRSLPRSPSLPPIPEVSLRPGDDQMAPFKRIVPFCWGAEAAPRPIYIGKWGLCPQFRAVPRQLVVLSSCQNPTA
ncbi:unnamed protein product [Rangifer tarandus platyrhynchus]|uniref:Uncharacterized protein n=2 Tax=Rangifer tarandus platyrhynchus TaxID=3082113 RepID=A0ACB0DXQ9_RANTA|nr:unnamed protein product [Rangifer tarandus platyrhynchus]CAI9692968.1 unnamed protein product [Rangifer tarandus platyrhynchus]